MGERLIFFFSVCLFVYLLPAPLCVCDTLCTLQSRFFLAASSCITSPRLVPPSVSPPSPCSARLPTSSSSPPLIKHSATWFPTRRPAFCPAALVFLEGNWAPGRRWRGRRHSRLLHVQRGIDALTDRWLNMP